MLLFIHTLIVLCADLAFYCKNSMGASNLFSSCWIKLYLPKAGCTRFANKDFAWSKTRLWWHCSFCLNSASFCRTFLHQCTESFDGHKYFGVHRGHRFMKNGIKDILLYIPFILCTIFTYYFFLFIKDFSQCTQYIENEHDGLFKIKATYQQVCFLQLAQ